VPYRIDNKFVSKEAYEAYIAEQENPVTETDTEAQRKPRTTSPLTAATARVRKAKAEYERIAKIHAKRAELPSLEDAEQEYADAKAALNDLI
jgi:hypothetical protein